MRLGLMGRVEPSWAKLTGRGGGKGRDGETLRRSNGGRMLEGCDELLADDSSSSGKLSQLAELVTLAMLILLLTHSLAVSNLPPK